MATNIKYLSKISNRGDRIMAMDKKKKKKKAKSKGKKSRG